MGFTTNPDEERSTPYAGDLAKGFNVPIIHVNADDVEASVAAIRLAMGYRERFGRDVVIDLIGYRRYGHNETDEPAYTQPKMAAQIKTHPPVSEIYAEQLVKEGTVTPDDVAADASERQAELSAAHKELKAKMESGDYEDPTATQIGTGELDRTKSPEVDTAVSEKRMRGLNEELLAVPEGFAIHRKLRKPLMKRLEILDDGPIEYGHAEGLAYASLLTEGTHIRLTGQDTERGTFSHRHLVLHDEKTGLRYAPIQNLSGALAPFEIHNSPLSEIACVGFEYGYAAASPESLVIWEAQFGDFANSAQVIIDSFIVAGEAKWGQTTRLTLLLPHGYEGSGPEHSSARIERFIQLAAEGNIRLANPTTAAQYFHLLRRQARIAKPRPLVVFTPPTARRLDQVEHMLEAVRSAIVRIGNFANAELGREVEEQSDMAVVRRRVASRSVRGGSRDPSRGSSGSAEIVVADLPRTLLAQVVAALGRVRDRAPVGRLADMPVAGAGRCDDDPVRHAGARRPLAKHALGGRRAADVAQADEQHRVLDRSLVHYSVSNPQSVAAKPAARRPIIARRVACRFMPISMNNPVRCALLVVALVAWSSASALAADMSKVLRMSSPDITSLDPQQGTDLYSTRIASHIFEGLYEFDYLATPAKVIPNTAEAHAADQCRRPHLDDQAQARHPVRRRPGIQGQAARARRRATTCTRSSARSIRTFAPAAIRR